MLHPYYSVLPSVAGDGTHPRSLAGRSLIITPALVDVEHVKPVVFLVVLGVLEA